MVNPCEIVEEHKTYSIGSFDGKEVIYDFEKILIYLDAKGKMLFGNGFKIYEEDRTTILKLCQYFIKDKEMIKFFVEDVEDKLRAYEPGNINMKPDVLKQMKELGEKRKKMEKKILKKIVNKYN